MSSYANLAPVFGLIVIISFAGGYFFNFILGAFFNKNGLTLEQIKLLNTANKIINEYAIEEHDDAYVVDFALKGMAAALDDEYAYYCLGEKYPFFLSFIVHL